MWIDKLLNEKQEWVNNVFGLWFDLWPSDVVPLGVTAVGKSVFLNAKCDESQKIYTNINKILIRCYQNYYQIDYKESNFQCSIFIYHLPKTHVIS